MSTESGDKNFEHLHAALFPRILLFDFPMFSVKEEYEPVCLELFFLE